MNAAYQSDALYIGGAWVEPHGRGRIEVRSPATGEIIGCVPDSSEEDIDRAVRAARRCFDESPWPRLSFAERAVYLRKAADALQANAQRFARVTTDESGLPYSTAAVYHVSMTVDLLRYYADLGEQTFLEEMRPSVQAQATVRREPVGVVGIIIPWNAPLLIAHFSLASALLAGCSIILKTAAEAPLHGQLLASIYDEIGLPPGVLNVVPAQRGPSEALVRHPGVDKISFTGSSATGRRIAALCGEQLKRCSLELGGKSAAIVLDDADLDTIMPRLVTSAVQNNCQACVGQTRILAPVSRYDEVVAAFAAQLDRLKIGDPNEPDTDIGPLISERQRDRVEGYIALGRAEGATLVRGGGRPAHLNRGWFVDLTLFRDVSNSMRIAREEIFGPVFVVIPYADEAEAIAIANDSDYGLAGTVWTSDRERGWRVARGVRTGMYGINMFGSELSTPFGGFKSSGIGRQRGPEGLSAFLELKAIIEPFVPSSPGHSNAEQPV